MKTINPPEERRRVQVIVGSLAILAVAVVIAICWMGRFLPGFAGEWFSMIVGIITTPVLMESSLFAMGILLVLLINHWRRRREGDEFVYLEQAEGPGSEKLPSDAKWAIYPDKPLDSGDPDALSIAEGAFDLGDYTATLEALTSMSDSERDQAAALSLRIRLAQATGKPELAERLQAQLDSVENH